MAAELADTRDPSSAEPADRPSADAIGLFGIYLNDHRARLRAAVAVARRSALVDERLGRLKTNGRLRSYSPLSRQVGREGVRAAVQAPVPRWRTVAEWRQRLPALPARADVDVDLEARSVRATRRSDGLDRHHREAVQAVLTSRGRS